MNINENIRQARADAGVSQAELAERIGVYQKDVCRWETGVRTPSLEMFAKICKALNVSADALLGIKCGITETDTDTFTCSACGYSNISYDDNRCPSCNREIDWKMSVVCQ